MREALAEAVLAAAEGEVPIGAVVVHEPTATIIGRGRNRRETDHDPTAHAEILALKGAGRSIGHWRILDCTLYVTLEPCPMCAGAMVNARLPRVVYGCDDAKAGAVKSLYTLCGDERLNHQVQVVAGVLAVECADVLREFFRERRARGQNGRRR
ncbi:nucleoside deaminase [Humisphaera borealis]|uniref:tRNA-specific adenosine deaminase n=2 Tax=Humisphaera borealis TaxID=2807512 RepID=A0A7M2X4K7_9BACT|nr:nucleoside deaminase [Humisphaera borealis]